METQERMEEIRHGDLPEQLFDQLIIDLEPYQVALLGIRRSNHGDSIAYRGSGVFVLRRGVKYLLTAAHVWSSMHEFEEIGLCIRQTIHELSITREDIVPHLVHSPRDLEWGPDIAFLELSERAASLVNADRQFFEIDPILDSGSIPTPDSSSGLIAVIGAPAESSDINQKTAALHAGPWIGAIERCYVNDNFDYFDLKFDPSSAELPKDFGGISGGPAWQRFVQRRTSDGQLAWAGSPQLLGIVVRQVELGGVGHFVRCHGPRSIYIEGPRQADIA